jgi:hypothetical protein
VWVHGEGDVEECYFFYGWSRVNGFVEKGSCGGLPSQALDLTVRLRTSKEGFSRLTCWLYTDPSTCAYKGGFFFQIL